MIRKHSLAAILLGAACAPLAAACGLSAGGLGGDGVDGSASGDASPRSDSAIPKDARQDVQADATADLDAADAVAQKDATLDDAGGSDGGDDGAAVDARDDGAAAVDAGDDDSATVDAGADASSTVDSGDGGGADAGAETGSNVDAGSDAGSSEAGGVDGGAADAASDTGSPVDAGSDGAGGVDAGHDAGGAKDGGVDAGSDAAATCDFAGTWGSRLVIDVNWTPQGITSIILAPGSGTITQWIKSTRTRNGSRWTETSAACGIQLPDFQSTSFGGNELYGIRFPNSLFDNPYIPTFDVSATIGGNAAGATYSTASAAVLLGLTLTNPTTAVWPSAATANGSQVDMDQDNHPGVTADTLNTAGGGGYTYPPTDAFRSAAGRADQLYLVIRQVTQLSATFGDCDHLTGTVSIPSIDDPSTSTTKAAIDSHIIGCRLAASGTTCSTTQSNFIDNTQPVFSPSGGSSFTSERMANTATCADVRTALP